MANGTFWRRDKVVVPVASEQGSGSLVARLLRSYLRPHAGRISIALVAMVAGAAATAGNAWLMQPVLDKVFIDRN